MADLHIGLAQLEKGEGTVIGDEAAHDAFFEEMENRLQQGLARKPFKQDTCQSIAVFVSWIPIH
jgi:hypothetical protein